MWFRCTGGVVDDFIACVGSIIPYYLCVILPALILISPVDPTKAAKDFTAYRLQHYDLQGVLIGSRSAAINCEAQALGSRVLARRCLLLRLAEATMDVIRNAIFHNVDGILIILPVNSWTENLKKHLASLEQEMLTDSYTIPIYFVLESDGFREVYDGVRQLTDFDVKSSSALAFLNAAWSTGYRLTVTASAKPLPHHELINIEGRCSGGDSVEPLPTLLFCSHYDAMSAIPGLAYGADANGSGVAVLLEIARILSQLFASARTKPKYNVMFLLTGGGKFNYLGAKKWLDGNVEQTSGLALLDAVSQVVCLEGLGTNTFGPKLYAHVSRPPKEGSTGFHFVEALNQAILLHRSTPTTNEDGFINSPPSVQVIHKKINLNQEQLAWEHERFSIHRLAGLTLSSWPSFQTANPLRQTALDGGLLQTSRLANGAHTGHLARIGSVDPAIVAENALIIAEATARLLFDVVSQPHLNETPLISKKWVTETTSGALLSLLTKQPRSTQMLSMPTSQRTPGVINKETVDSAGLGLLGSLEKHLKNLMPFVHVSRHRFSAGSPTPVTPSSNKANSGSGGANAGKASNTAMPETEPIHHHSVTEAAAAGDVDVLLYSGTAPVTLSVYRLKSSMFDLVIACAVAAYLGVLFLIFEHFGQLQLLMNRVVRYGEKLKVI